MGRKARKRLEANGVIFPRPSLRGLSPLFIILTLIFSLRLDPVHGQSALKVGALVPYSGRWGELGRECARGMLDAGKWINQQGGIDGRKLDILVINDTYQIPETVAAFRKLNEAERILIFYVYSTETALTLLLHTKSARMPTCVSFLPSHLADPARYPFLFSIVPTPLDLSKIALTFISEKSGMKAKKPTLLFIGSSDYLDRHFLEEAKAFAYAQGFEVGPDVLFTPETSARTLSSLLEPINRHNPDFAYLSLTPKETSSIVRETKPLGLKTRWIANMKAFNETLAPFEGIFGVQPLSPFGDTVPGMMEIQAAHERWHPYDSHTLSYTEGWATTLVMAEALERSLPEERLSRDRVKSSLETFKHFITGGLVPPITITRDDHRPSVESRIFVTKNNRLVPHTSFVSIGREGRSSRE